MTHDTSTHIHDPDPPITLTDLGPYDCRYPFGDRDITFCGHLQQDGSSYCPTHHAICWVKPTGRGMKTSGRWSSGESEQLYELRTSGKTIKEIAADMGRSEHSVEARWRWLHVTEEERERRRQAEYARRRTLGMKVRGRNGACGRVDQSQRSYPIEVFIDRDAREKTPRTLTAVLCGDPTPGWSALDRKMQGVRA